MRTTLLIMLMSMTAATAPCQKRVEVQGHRGVRAYLPENTIEGFLKAIEMGVDVVEMDVVISADRKVVVSHEPFMNPDFCSLPDGSPVKDRSVNLYELTYDEIRSYDCGSRGNSSYPEQQKLATIKPLLSDALEAIENASDRPVKINLEIKSKTSEVNVSQPDVEVFTDLVYGIIKDWPIDRINIQSFDPDVLRAWKRKYPEHELSFLIANLKSWEGNVKELGFQPEIYSPNWKLVGKKSVRQMQKVGMKVIPWTVNEEKAIKKCLAMGVDGIISDYPDRVLKMAGR